MRLSLWVILLGVAGFAVWVRVAPSDPVRWHIALDFDVPADQMGGAQRIVSGDVELLARLDEIIRTTSRTMVLTGSVADRHVTYVTRSALWGFPDYTTVQLAGDRIRVWGRLRFGRSDLAVNRSRIEGWLQALGER